MSAPLPMMMVMMVVVMYTRPGPRSMMTKERGEWEGKRWLYVVFPSLAGPSSASSPLSSRVSANETLVLLLGWSVGRLVHALLAPLLSPFPLLSSSSSKSSLEKKCGRGLVFGAHQA